MRALFYHSKASAGSRSGELPRSRGGWALHRGAAAWLCLCLTVAWAQGGVLINKVSPANISPSTFSIIAAASPASAAQNFSLSIFADAGGVTNLAGQIGIEYDPLNSGNPLLTNAYAQLRAQAALRQQTRNRGLLYARVSYCAPNTTYYYRLQVTDTNGQTAVYPASGPLPAVTTARETSFLLDSVQVVVTVNDSILTGGILTIADTNSASVLAAVVGDGAGTNQAYFNLGDLLAAVGGTNLAATGNEPLTANVLNSGPSSLSQDFVVSFSPGFFVSQQAQFSLTPALSILGLGSTAALSGGQGSLPLMLNSLSGLSGFSVVLNLPVGLFSDFFVQSTTPLLEAVSLRVLGPQRLQINFAAPPGQSFVGNQQVAKISFDLEPHLPSAFVMLAPSSFNATNFDGLLLTNAIADAGRLVVIGSQPLLDSSVSNNTRLLTLYGTPGNSYQIQSSTDVANPNGWTDWVRVSLTNLWTTIPNVNSTAPLIFYRAYR